MLIVKFVLKVANIICAILLVVAFISRYIPGENLPFVSTFGLAVPVLIIVNLLFAITWLMMLDIFCLYSVFALLVGIGQWEHFFAVGGASDPSIKGDIKILSYNVRSFNAEKWSSEPDIPKKIEELIKEQDPDIICFQEYQKTGIDLSRWRYHHRANTTAIYSKYPIKTREAFEFKDSFNDAIYADVSLPNGKTVRVYCIHLQSLSIHPEEVNDLYKEASGEVKSKVKGLIKRIDKGFCSQQSQANQIRDNMDGCPFPKIVAGDFNNTSFSRTFHTMLGGDMYDTFSEGSWGFGRTFHMIKIYPLRIDFIIAQQDTFKTNSFKVINKKLSDHYPIVSSLSFSDKK